MEGVRKCLLKVKLSSKVLVLNMHLVCVCVLYCVCVCVTTASGQPWCVYSTVCAKTVSWWLLLQVDLGVCIALGMCQDCHNDYCFKLTLVCVLLYKSIILCVCGQDLSQWLLLQVAMHWWWQQTLRCMPRATLGARGVLVLWPCCWDPMHHSSLTEVGVVFMAQCSNTHLWQR